MLKENFKISIAVEQKTGLKSNVFFFF